MYKIVLAILWSSAFNSCTRVLYKRRILICGLIWINPNIVRTLASLLFWSLFHCLWKFLCQMEGIPARSYFNIADLPISRMPAIRISLSIDACHTVVSMTFTKNKKNVIYFVWWIIWHFVRTDTHWIYENWLTVLSNLYFLLLLSIATLTLLTKTTSTTGSKYLRTRLILQSVNMIFKYWICAV